jgi:hypothetical protein
MSKNQEPTLEVINACQASFDTLCAIETSFKGGVPPTPEELSGMVNNVVSSLKNLHDSGNSAYSQVPLDMLTFLDEDTKTHTPDMYQNYRVEKIEEDMKKCDERVNRLLSLQQTSQKKK